MNTTAVSCASATKWYMFDGTYACCIDQLQQRTCLPTSEPTPTPTTAPTASPTWTPTSAPTAVPSAARGGEETTFNTIIVVVVAVVFLIAIAVVALGWWYCARVTSENPTRTESSARVDNPGFGLSSVEPDASVSVEVNEGPTVNDRDGVGEPAAAAGSAVANEPFYDELCLNRPHNNGADQGLAAGAADEGRLYDNDSDVDAANRLTSDDKKSGYMVTSPFRGPRDEGAYNC